MRNKKGIQADLFSPQASTLGLIDITKYITHVFLVARVWEKLDIVIILFSLNLKAQKIDIVRAVEMDDVAKVRKLITSGHASVDEKSNNDEPIILVAPRARSEKVTNYLGAH